MASSSGETMNLVTAGIAAVGVLTAVVALSRLLKQPIVLPKFPSTPKKPLTGGLIVVAPRCGVIHGEDLREFQVQLRQVRGPVDIVIHCYGGLISAVNSMVQAIRSYPGVVTAYVPYFAFSGGTMLALASRKIVMGDTALLGPVDPQLGGVPASTLMELQRRKSADAIDDKSHLLAIEAEKYHRESVELVKSLGVSKEALEVLTRGDITHGAGINYARARELSLPVAKGMPATYYQLVEDRTKPGILGL